MLEIDKNDVKEVTESVNFYNKYIDSIIEDIEKLKINKDRSIDVIYLQKMEKEIKKFKFPHKKVIKEFSILYNLYTYLLAEHVSKLKKENKPCEM